MAITATDVQLRALKERVQADRRVSGTSGVLNTYLQASEYQVIEMMVHGGDGEQRGDRRVVDVDTAVGEHENRRSRGDRIAGVAAQIVECALERVRAAAGMEERRERDGVQGGAIAECARSAGAEVVLETTYCFV